MYIYIIRLHKYISSSDHLISAWNWSKEFALDWSQVGEVIQLICHSLFCFLFLSIPFRDTNIRAHVPHCTCKSIHGVHESICTILFKKIRFWIQSYAEPFPHNEITFFYFTQTLPFNRIKMWRATLQFTVYVHGPKINMSLFSFQLTVGTNFNLATHCTTQAYLELCHTWEYCKIFLYIQQLIQFRFSPLMDPVMTSSPQVLHFIGQSCVKQIQVPCICIYTIELLLIL